MLCHDGASAPLCMLQVIVSVNIGNKDVYVFPRCASEDAWHGASAVANEMVQELCVRCQERLRTT